MDNFSQEESQDINQTSGENQPEGDIQFEEILDIDKLQAELNRQLEKDKQKEQDPDAQLSKPDESENKSEINKEEKMPPVVQSAQAQVIPNAKKYVIYIDSFNLDYIDNLSIEERRVLINKVLREQKGLTEEKKKFQEKKQFLTHLIIAVLTFVISFPVIFFCVNKAMEATIVNYRQAQINFGKLYKEHGKIQPK